MADLVALESRIPAVLVLLARLGGFFTSAPIFSSRYIPVTIKTAFVLYLAVFLSPMIPLPYAATMQALIWLMICELLVGLAAGYISSLVFLSVQVAGQIADTEMGFGMVNVLDPQYGVPIPLMGSFKYLLALLLFLAIDGHHFVLTAIVRSYELVAPGQGAFSPRMYDLIVRQMSQAFQLGVQLALPIMVSAFLATVAMGVIARAVPQMNVFVMGLPVKIVLGTAIITVCLPVFSAFAQNAFRVSFEWLSGFFTLLKN